MEFELRTFQYVQCRYTDRFIPLLKMVTKTKEISVCRGEDTGHQKNHNNPAKRGVSEILEEGKGSPCTGY